MSAWLLSCSLFCHIVSCKLVIQELFNELVGYLCWRRGEGGMGEQNNTLNIRSSMLPLSLLLLFSSACASCSEKQMLYCVQIQ